MEAWVAFHIWQVLGSLRCGGGEGKVYIGIGATKQTSGCGFHACGFFLPTMVYYHIPNMVYDACGFFLPTMVYVVYAVYVVYVACVVHVVMH